jgi:hypothetical protein
MIYCKETDFKNSSYGQNKIAEIKRKYATSLRPITDSMFTYVFLKSYFDQNNRSGNLVNVTCYQTLLEFWLQDRYNALLSESELSQANKAYESWVKNNKNPIDSILDIFKNIPVVIALIAIIVLIKK